MFDVYSSLRRKEEVLRSMEERLNRKLGEKEDHCMNLQNQISLLEQNFSKETNNLEQLRSMYEERNNEGASLDKTLKEKEVMIRDIKAEQVQMKLNHERAYREREEELLEQIQQLNIKEFGLTQQTQKLQKNAFELDEQTCSA